MQRPEDESHGERPRVPAGEAAHTGPSPSWAVTCEVARALGAGALLLPRVAGFVLDRETALREVESELLAPAPSPVSARAAFPRERALTIFVACAEVSGEVHAVNVVRALQRLAAEQGAPAPRFLGFGGAALAGAGVATLENPVARAQMGLGVWSSVPWYARLLKRAGETFRDERPDVLLAVDSPALHVPLARVARRFGVPVVHFVTPQYWGWAPWRTRDYVRAVDVALSILPFEKAWFERRGVPITHVGHPLLDALVDVPRTTPRDDARTLVLLPGSRSGVIARNLPWMLELAARLRRRHGDLPVVVAHDRTEIAREIRVHVEREGASSWARLASGGLHETLADARAAISVSGTVLLDLLHHDLPTLVVYRLGRAIEVELKEKLLSVPWFGSVNLLAGREVFPEFCFAGDGPLDVATEALSRLYVDGPPREACREGMALARERLGPPGACERAALATLALLERRAGRKPGSAEARA